MSACGACAKNRHSTAVRTASCQTSPMQIARHGSLLPWVDGGARAWRRPRLVGCTTRSPPDGCGAAGSGGAGAPLRSALTASTRLERPTSARQASWGGWCCRSRGSGGAWWPERCAAGSGALRGPCGRIHGRPSSPAVLVAVEALPHRRRHGPFRFAAAPAPKRCCSATRPAPAYLLQGGVRAAELRRRVAAARAPARNREPIPRAAAPGEASPAVPSRPQGCPALAGDGGLVPAECFEFGIGECFEFGIGGYFG